MAVFVRRSSVQVGYAGTSGVLDSGEKTAKFYRGFRWWYWRHSTPEVKAGKCTRYMKYNVTGY